MAAFTFRQIEILKILASRNDYVTSNAITSILNITRRTLISDIKVINYNNEFIISNNKGYKINDEHSDEINSILFNYQDDDKNLDSIIRYILIKNSNVTINELLNSFYISDSKLVKFFDQINKQIKPYNLTINRKNNIVSIDGDEQDKRLLLGNIIHNESYSFFSDIDNFKDYFPNIPVDEICPMVVSVINEYGYSIPKYYEINFLINILVTLSRNPFIISNSYEQSPNTSKDYESRVIAYKINEMLETKFHIHYINKLITIKEIEQILEGFIARDDQKPRVFDLSDSFVMIIRNIVEETFKYYYLTSIDYQDFLSVFCIHVSEMIKRCMNSISYVPTNISIKQNAPYVYEIAVSIASRIAKTFNINIPEIEINLISIHIGYAIEQAIDKSSIAPIAIVTQFEKSGDLIADKIVKTIGYKVQIMGFYSSAYEIPYGLYKKCLIVSTEKEDVNNKNLCIISPFALDSDVIKLQETITSFIKDRNNKEVSQLIDKYLNNDTFFIVDEAMDKEDAINYLCAKAFENGDVLKDFNVQVLNREKLSSTCFFNKFAIPHSNIQNANNTKLYVLINNNKVIWDRARIKIVCLILIKRETNDDFRKLYAGLSEILCNNTSLFDNVDKINSLDDFLYYLLR